MVAYASRPIAYVHPSQHPYTPLKGYITGQVCPFCGQSGEGLGIKDDVVQRICECRGTMWELEGSQVLLSFPWEGERDYDAFYSDPTAYHVDEQAANGQQPFASRKSERLRAASNRLNVIRSWFPQRTYGRYDTLLDVGCATGEMVELASAFNFDGYGIDPCAEVLPKALCGQIGHYSPGSWQDVTPHPDGKPWDVIVLSDVLEHLTRPWSALEHLHKNLAPGGVLYIEMPEWGCRQSREQLLNWRHIRPRQHVCLYSQKAAETLFEISGFRIVAMNRPLLGSIGKIAWLLQPDS